MMQLQWVLCIGLLPFLCSSARVLLGVEIDSGTADSGIAHEYLTNAVRTAQVMTADLEGKLGHQVEVFACFSHAASSILVASSITLLTTMRIRYYFSSASDNSVCTLEYPNSLLPGYAALISIRAGYHREDAWRSLLQGGSDRNTIFAVSVRSLIEANTAQMSLSNDKRASRISRERRLISQLLIEHHRDFPLLQYLGEQRSSLQTDAKPPAHPHFPLFTPSALEVKHQSGPCQLWWPLDGNTKMYYPSASAGLSEVETVLFSCDFRDLLNDEEITFSYDFVQNGQKFRILNSASPFKAADNTVIKLAASVPYSEGSYRSHIEVTSPRRGLLSRFDVMTVRIQHDDLVTPQALVLEPMILQMRNRNNLGMFMNSLGLIGTFVEVGVHKGEFAAVTLQHWQGARYVAVDPWEEALAEDYVDEINIGINKNRTNDMDAFLTAVSGHLHRVTTLRMYSANAAADFVDASIDGVFIDAVHTYHMVMQDMQAWWPKIKSGGIMMGHDYFLNLFGTSIYTVEPAVLEFSREFNLPVMETRDGCWYIMKP